MVYTSCGDPHMWPARGLGNPLNRKGKIAHNKIQIRAIPFEILRGRNGKFHGSPSHFYFFADPPPLTYFNFFRGPPLHILIFSRTLPPHILIFFSIPPSSGSQILKVAQLKTPTFTLLLVIVMLPIF